MADFGGFVSREKLCWHVLAHISHDNSKTGPEWLLFSV